MSFPMKKGAGYAGLFIISLILLFSTESSAQKRLRYKADNLTGQRVDGVRTDYLVGDVVIRQDETTIYADSAIVNKNDNVAQAFGNVRITEGDSVDIRSKRLLYGGGSGTARLRESVVYSDGSKTLYTDSLDYNKFDGIARYFEGGRMVDGDNTLSSQIGIFDKQNQSARFYGKVELETPERRILSDTLIYNTETKMANFKGLTHIIPKDGSETAIAENGFIYDTRSESTTLLAGKVENQDYVITGKKLNYDQLNDVFTAVGDVVMTSKTDDVVITGGRSVYNKKTGRTHVYENPVMQRPVQGDTLYLSADTLVAIETELDADKRMLAYNNVRIFKKDLQGIADSLAYFFSDSSIFFYQDPVLWNEGNQMTGDTISVLMRNNNIDRLTLHTNGFVISKDSLEERYNQIKGRQIVAIFKDEHISRINVDGNGESIYFVLEEKDNSLVGMNRITSGAMRMFFEENQLEEIKFYQQPEGKLIPPHELNEPDTRLTGFSWRGKERPSKESVLNGTPEESVPVPEGGEVEIPENTSLRPEQTGTGQSGTRQSGNLPTDTNQREPDGSVAPSVQPLPNGNDGTQKPTPVPANAGKAQQ